MLHDVVEDSAGKVTFDDLEREGFSQEIIDGVRGDSGPPFVHDLSG